MSPIARLFVEHMQTFMWILCAVTTKTHIHVLYHCIITPCTCAKSKVIGLYVCCCCCHVYEHRDLQASEQLLNTMNRSKSAKNWLQYASNRLAQPTRITNSAFMLPTPIGHTTASHVLSAHVHN